MLTGYSIHLTIYPIDVDIPFIQLGKKNHGYPMKSHQKIPETICFPWNTTKTHGESIGSPEGRRGPRLLHLGRSLLRATARGQRCGATGGRHAAAGAPVMCSIF